MCAKNFINGIKKHIDLGEFEAAEELVKEYKKQFIINAEIYSIIGIIAINKGNLKKAKNVFEKGLKGFPNDFDLNFNLAFVYENLSKLEKAFDFYYRAKELTNKEDNLREIGNSIDRIIKIDKSIITSRKKRIVFFVKKGMDSFLNVVISGFKEKFNTKKVIVENYSQIDKWSKWADIIWYEWCDELVIYGSKLSITEEKKVVCRIHGYEVYSNNIINTNWDNIDNLIIVTPHIKRVFEKRVEKEILKDLSIDIVFCGIDISKYPFHEKSKGYNLGYLGYINYKKNIPLTLDIFKKLYDLDPKYQLFMAGKFEDYRTKQYLEYFIKENNLQNNFHFSGWLNYEKKIEWLENIDYMVISSIDEGISYVSAEAMSSGIKPVLHNCEGIKDHYLNRYIFNDVDEAVEMVTSNNYNSNEYRDYIRDNFSSKQQTKNIYNVLFNNISINKIKKPKRNLILTGVPKSGTTLLSSLISKMENSMCLDEIFYDTKNLNMNLNKTRRRLIVKSSIPNSYTKKGELSTNKRGEGREIRYKIINRNFDEEAIVGSKVNVPYLVHLDKLTRSNYKLIAMVRNPIYTIASWRSWVPEYVGDLIHEAKVAKGEVDNRYKNFSFKSNKTVERQAEIWNYLASIIWNNRKKIKIYKYENLTENTLTVLDDIADYLKVDKSNEDFELKNMNINSRYQDLDKIKRAVQKYAPISKKFGYK